MEQQLEAYLSSLHDDPLEAAASMTGSLASMEAEQYAYLAEFLHDCAEDPALSAFDGGERRFAYGGAGTPAIPEFAVTQVQVQLGLSPYAAQRLVADVMSLTHRLPGVLAAMADGQVQAWRARMVATATRDLPLADVARVQEVLLEGVRGGVPLVARITRKRLQQVLDQVEMTVLPEGVAEEIEHWLAARDVTIRPGERGTSVLSGTVSTADGARLTHRLTQVADWWVELGDTRTRSVLRSVALGMLADPGMLDNLYARVCAHRAGQDLLDLDLSDVAPSDLDPLAPAPSGHPLPATVLYVHHEPDTTERKPGGCWSLDGPGALSADQAAELVGHSHVTLKPVIDLAAPIQCPGYVASPRLKEHLALMNAGLCTFPYCDQPATGGDYDHRQPYPRGPTTQTNGHLLCRRHHRAKTFARWRVQSVTTGVWLWTSPTGDHYVVTAGTTTPLVP